MIPPQVLIVLHFLFKLTGVKWFWNFTGDFSTTEEPVWDSNKEKMVGGTLAEEKPLMRMFLFIFGLGSIYLLVISLIVFPFVNFQDAENTNTNTRPIDYPSFKEMMDATPEGIQNLREWEIKLGMPQGMLTNSAKFPNLFHPTKPWDSNATKPWDSNGGEKDKKPPK